RGQPTLKAFGKLRVWWSPHEDAPVFKVPFEEREILVEAEPETFFFTAHYKGHPMVLVRPEKLDLEWAKANLLRVWRAQAPSARSKHMTPRPVERKSLKFRRAPYARRPLYGPLNRRI